jgi:peptidoglycan hydrolase-like protein with peptidoglycan-binding domain
VVTPSAAGTVAPKYPGYLLKQGTKADPNVRIWQAQVKARGAKLSVDGVFGPGTRSVLLNIQKLNGLSADGVIGPKSWTIPWDKTKKIV